MPHNFVRHLTSASSRIRSYRPRRSVLVVGSVVAIASVVATGFAAQTAIAEQAERETATTVLTESTGLRSEQLPIYAAMLDSRAANEADAAVAAANETIAAADGKADAAALAAAVTELADRDALSTKRIFELVYQLGADTATVQGAIAEADRVAAEQAAAAQAAAVAAASRPAAPTNPSAAQAIARDMMAAQYGWGDDQFGCLVALWNKESGWNANAYNASSGAAGIPQALPGSKMASAGADWQTNPATQIAWGLGYIASRHGDPCGAWSHAQSTGWY
ncbi:hypothetical protein FB562_1289 [Homoserinimonas aerilata]|uniref:Transglycosylase-like protein with SLT domain n=1 Tax=Homoserinimonas aerilata TaxID=1162970 RepID=A0A542YJD7_9MICO|nr:hypothetical protein [Homoserinimonas aerilata]TQL48203.1 hypothetical protein FB562_1289 [Homoserinimonas aerilata]